MAARLTTGCCTRGGGQEQPVVLRSFASSVPLEDYSYWVKLPEL